MQLAKYASRTTKLPGDIKSLKRRLQHASSSIAILLITVVASGTVFAQSSGSTCPPVVTDLVFSNGVLTTVSQAMISEVKLCQNYSGHLLASATSGNSPMTLHCGLAINQTEGPIADLLEAALLSVQSSVTEFFRVLSGVDPMPAVFQTVLQNAAAVAALPDVTSGDLTNQVAMYQAFAAAGDRVVIVAHSEGNFFANLAYAQLSPSDAAHVGVVGVADPDSHVAAGGPYTTFISDLIIEVATAARALAGLTTLPPNASAASLPALNNSLDHAFVEAYLAGEPSTIFGDIDTVAAGLISATCNEPGSVTLTFSGLTAVATFVPMPVTGIVTIHPNAAPQLITNLLASIYGSNGTGVAYSSTNCSNQVATYTIELPPGSAGSGSPASTFSGTSSGTCNDFIGIRFFPTAPIRNSWVLSLNDRDPFACDTDLNFVPPTAQWPLDPTPVFNLMAVPSIAPEDISKVSLASPFLSQFIIDNGNNSNSCAQLQGKTSSGFSFARVFFVVTSMTLVVH
jgi:hypothetical protein